MGESHSNLKRGSGVAVYLNMIFPSKNLQTTVGNFSIRIKESNGHAVTAGVPFSLFSDGEYGLFS